MIKVIIHSTCLNSYNFKVSATLQKLSLTHLSLEAHRCSLELYNLTLSSQFPCDEAAAAVSLQSLWRSSQTQSPITGHCETLTPYSQRDENFLAKCFKIRNTDQLHRKIMLSFPLPPEKFQSTKTLSQPPGDKEKQRTSYGKEKRPCTCAKADLKSLRDVVMQPISADS